MKQLSATRVYTLADDIQIELTKLERLAIDIKNLQQQLLSNPELAGLYHENLALKLHNFYTGCEHIFQLIASELNGAKRMGLIGINGF